MHIQRIHSELDLLYSPHLLVLLVLRLSPGWTAESEPNVAFVSYTPTVQTANNCLVSISYISLEYNFQINLHILLLLNMPIMHVPSLSIFLLSQLPTMSRETWRTASQPDPGAPPV